MRIGFIGLGIMGRAMCRDLLEAGHELVVSSHNAAAAGELVALGARQAETPSEIAALVDLVITMLPNSPQVTEVALGSNGVIAGAHLGLSYVDMSSIAPLELHIKDLVNALDTSHEVGASLPLTAAVLEMMTALKAAGHGSEDHSGLVQHYEQLATSTLTRSQS